MKHIAVLYPDSIFFNPKDIKISEVDNKKLKGAYHDYIDMTIKYFFPVIDQCDIVIAIKNSKGILTHGVKTELQYAKSKNKLIVEYEKL